MLVRGHDHGNFELETPPDDEFSDAAIAVYLREIEAPSGLGRAAKRAVND